VRISELKARLDDIEAEYGDVHALFPGADPGRFLSVEDVAVVQCTADEKGVKRATGDAPALMCLVLYN
jgi:hypothetical protein